MASYQSSSAEVKIMHQATNDIIRDCQPFLSLMRKGCGPLFRGMKLEGGADFIQKKEIRRDRMPRNMPWMLHKQADKWFAERFGVRYRGASLFCTGSLKQASEFDKDGKVGMVFPIEGFQFCWSPLVKDLFEWSVEKQLVKKSASSSESIALCTPDAYVRRLEELDYKECNLGSAVEKGVEIMLSCRAYHAVLVETEEKVKELLIELGVRERG